MAEVKIPRLEQADLTAEVARLNALVEQHTAQLQELVRQHAAQAQELESAQNQALERQEKIAVLSAILEEREQEIGRCHQQYESMEQALLEKVSEQAETHLHEVTRLTYELHGLRSKLQTHAA